MWKIIITALVVSFAVNVTPQFRQIGEILTQLSPITDYFNNISVSDVASVLKWLPFPNPLVFDGQPVRPNDVMFYLYTRRNPDYPEILKVTSKRFNYFNPKDEVKFIIHGWIEDANRTYVRGLINAYLKRGEYNVFGVNWAVPAANEYTISSRNTKTSGRALGDFIIRLTKHAGISLKQVHILGHSLGAHLAGFAGKRIQARSGQKVARITALDAAGPLFEVPIPVRRINRLDKLDADFVDCIHTDGGIFGITQAICDADFFPNGGTPRQPGCTMIDIRDISSRVIVDDSLVTNISQKTPNTNINIFRFFKHVFCSHYRSHELYRESINSNGFLSTSCDTFENYKNGFCKGRLTIPMGEETPTTARGKFYLETNAAQPYAKS